MEKLHFPAKVYQILEQESPEIIRWEHDGKTFRILDYEKFGTEVIPKYFRHTRLPSVQRQLNLYGFKCVQRGSNKGAFYHPQFNRGAYDQVREIHRVTTSNKKNQESVSVSLPPSQPDQHEHQQQQQLQNQEIDCCKSVANSQHTQAPNHHNHYSTNYNNNNDSNNNTKMNQSISQPATLTPLAQLFLQDKSSRWSAPLNTPTFTNMSNNNNTPSTHVTHTHTQPTTQTQHMNPWEALGLQQYFHGNGPAAGCYGQLAPLHTTLSCFNFNLNNNSLLNLNTDTQQSQQQQQQQQQQQIDQYNQHHKQLLHLHQQQQPVMFDAFCLDPIIMQEITRSHQQHHQQHHQIHHQQQQQQQQQHFTHIANTEATDTHTITESLSVSPSINNNTNNNTTNIFTEDQLWATLRCLEESNNNNNNDSDGTKVLV